MKETVTLAEAEWQKLELQHEQRTRPWVEGRLKRREWDQKHPVEDFVFDYYPFRPSLLQRWSPGHGVLLLGNSAQKFLAHSHFVLHLPEGVWIDPELLPESRLNGLAWAITILRSIETREPQYGCFGLHEWAMVYRAPEVRHTGVPLRMPPAELAAFVESQRVACSHYDAFRFFTPEARPLNQLQPQKGQQPEWEQAGCLHVNMDLYKWAYKFYPWVPSELVADAFELARSIREVDMRASPYDLEDQGYPAIRIETPLGRREYERFQRCFTEQAVPIRQRLLACLEGLSHRRLAGTLVPENGPPEINHGKNRPIGLT